MSDAASKIDYAYKNRNKKRITRCNLCGRTTFVTITHRDRYGYKATADSCDFCSLTFLNPVMTSEEYAHFYQEVYRPLLTAFYNKLYDAQTIQGMQQIYAQERVTYLKPYLEGFKGKSMLDIGGSTGIVSRHFQEVFGLNPTVVDPAPLEIAKAQAFGLKTITGFVEDYDADSQSFDFIAMFQTIDHLLDINRTLTKVHQMLADDGLFYVDIVDFRAAYLRNAAVEKAIKIDHPYYLTDTTMRLYLETHNFSITGMEFAADHLHIGYICKKSISSGTVRLEKRVSEEFFSEIRKIQNPPLQNNK